MTSIFGKSLISIAGLISLFGPAKDNGEALSENIGSNKIVISPLLTRNVEWPIHKAYNLRSSKN